MRTRPLRFLTLAGFALLSLMSSVALAQTSVQYMRCIVYVAPAAYDFDHRVQAAQVCQNVNDVSCVSFIAPPAYDFDHRTAAAESCQGSVLATAPNVIVEKVADLSCANYVAPPSYDFKHRTTALEACKRTSVRIVGNASYH